MIKITATPSNLTDRDVVKVNGRFFDYVRRGSITNIHYPSDDGIPRIAFDITNTYGLTARCEIYGGREAGVLRNQWFLRIDWGKNGVDVLRATSAVRALNLAFQF